MTVNSKGKQEEKSVYKTSQSLSKLFNRVRKGK
jgi:hypothetical protein